MVEIPNYLMGVINQFKTGGHHLVLPALYHRTEPDKVTEISRFAVNTQLSKSHLTWIMFAIPSHLKKNALQWLYSGAPPQKIYIHLPFKINSISA